MGQVAAFSLHMVRQQHDNKTKNDGQADQTVRRPIPCKHRKCLNGLPGMTFAHVLVNMMCLHVHLCQSPMHAPAVC